MAFTVRAATDLAALEALQAAWENLTRQGAGDSLFGSYIWNLTWWRHYQSLGELRVLTAADGEEIVGIWPLFATVRTYGEVEVEMISPRKCTVSRRECCMVIVVLMILHT